MIQVPVLINDKHHSAEQGRQNPPVHPRPFVLSPSSTKNPPASAPDGLRRLAPASEGPAFRAASTSLEKGTRGHAGHPLRWCTCVDDSKSRPQRLVAPLEAKQITPLASRRFHHAPRAYDDSQGAPATASADITKGTVPTKGADVSIPYSRRVWELPYQSRLPVSL
jgi:hypothetical protein